MRMGKTKVRVVLYQTDGLWAARCLEHDIAAFAPTLSAVTKKLQRAMAAEIMVNTKLGREGLEGIPPAPERYAALYEAAQLQLSSRVEPSASAEGVEADLRVSEAA